MDEVFFFKSIHNKKVYSTLLMLFMPYAGKRITTMVATTIQKASVIDELVWDSQIETNSYLQQWVIVFYLTQTFFNYLNLFSLIIYVLFRCSISSVNF